MRVAVLNDIHGNLDALDAVLADVADARAHRIIVGGDVFPGPLPSQTLTRLTSLDIPVQFIYGNGEIAVLDVLAGREPVQVPQPYRAAIRWTAEQLLPEQQHLLAGWPKTLRIDIPGIGPTLFCHGTPRDENEIFTERTAENLLLPLFEPLGVALVVCGHTHMPFDRTVGTTRVVNAGSVGMPFGQTGADWLLIDSAVEFRHTSYDLTKAAETIRASGYPGADEFADRYLLHPPSAEQILAAYAHAELKSGAAAEAPRR